MKIQRPKYARHCINLLLFCVRSGLIFVMFILAVKKTYGEKEKKEKWWKEREKKHYSHLISEKEHFFAIFQYVFFSIEKMFSN